MATLKPLKPTTQWKKHLTARLESSKPNKEKIMIKSIENSVLILTALKVLYKQYGLIGMHRNDLTDYILKLGLSTSMNKQYVSFLLSYLKNKADEKYFNNPSKLWTPSQCLMDCMEEEGVYPFVLRTHSLDSWK